jgi:hypothetical protein
MNQGSKEGRKEGWISRKEGRISRKEGRKARKQYHFCLIFQVGVEQERHHLHEKEENASEGRGYK